MFLSKAETPLVVFGPKEPKRTPGPLPRTCAGYYGPQITAWHWAWEAGTAVNDSRGADRSRRRHGRIFDALIFQKHFSEKIVPITNLRNLKILSSFFLLRKRKYSLILDTVKNSNTFKNSKTRAIHKFSERKR